MVVAQTLRNRLGGMDLDINANQVDQCEWTHRPARSRLQGAIDVGRVGARLGVRAHRVVEHRHKNAIDNEARGIRARNRLFAEPLGKFDRGRIDGGIHVLGMHNLNERHHGRGIEEVQADDAFGATARLGDTRHANCRCVRCKDRIRLRRRRELAKQVVLDLWDLGNRLDDQISVGETVDAGSGRQARERSGTVLGRQRTLGDAALEPLLDTAAKIVSSGVDAIHPNHGVARGETDLHDPGAHGAKPDNSHNLRHIASVHR